MYTVEPELSAHITGWPYYRGSAVYTEKIRDWAFGGRIAQGLP